MEEEKELTKLAEPKQVSRRRIGGLMREIGLVSNYTMTQFKPHKSSCNEAPVKHELKREFNQAEQLEAAKADFKKQSEQADADLKLTEKSIDAKQKALPLLHQSLLLSQLRTKKTKRKIT